MRTPDNLGASVGRASPTRDALGLLTAYVAVLVGVPANLIVEPLGAAGTPAGIAATIALMWWFLARLLPGSGTSWAYSPVRLAVGVLGLSVLAAYVSAALAGLPAEQMSGADRGVIAMLGWLGIAFVATDMLSSLESVTRLVRRITFAAAFLAAIGIVQFVVGWDLAALIQVPGLTSNTVVEFVGMRSDVRRVGSTTTHPIEFGVVLAAVFPIALTLALTEKERKAWSRWAVVSAIGIAMPMSVSRSAIVGLGVGLVVLFAAWSGVRRAMLILVTPVILVVMRFAIPGLLGTIASLFAEIGTDPSVQGRTDDYAVVGDFISRSPIFGRGFGTFLPTEFVVLDNQYLGSIVETGVFGTGALLGVFVVGFASSRGVHLRAVDEQHRELGVALSVSLIVLGVGYAFFDGLGFPVATGLIFLLVGCVGALWRLTGGRPLMPIDPGVIGFEGSTGRGIRVT